MYTIDEMIERLKELREIAPDVGKTAVVIYSGTTTLVSAAAELQHAYKRNRVDQWGIDDTKNNCTVLTIF